MSSNYMAVFGNSNNSEDKKLKKVDEVQFPNPHGNIEFDLRYNNPLSLNEVEGILDYVESQAPPKTIIEANTSGGELEGYEIKPSQSMDEQEILLDENENLKAATAVWEFNYPSPIYNLPDEPPERFKQSDTFPPKGKAFTHIYGFEFSTGDRVTEFYTFSSHPERVEHESIQKELTELQEPQIQTILDDALSSNISKPKNEESAPMNEGNLENESEISIGRAYDPEGYSWNDLGASTELKQKLIQSIQNPLEAPELFEHAGVEPDGVILYGPPGTGKTLSTKIAASQADATVIEASGADIFDSLIGESETNIQSLYEVARENAPSMILLDEIDSLTQNRSSGGNEARYGVVTQMLAEIDGLNENSGPVLTVGTTNRLDQVDPAFKRGGRLGMQIEMPEPVHGAREEIFQIKTTTDPDGDGVLVSDEIDYKALADITEGFTGADIEKAVQEAAKANIGQILDRVSNPEPEDHVEDLRVEMPELERIINELNEGESEDLDRGPTGRTFQ